MKKQILSYTNTQILTLDNNLYPITDIKTLYCNKTRLNSNIVALCRYNGVKIVEVGDGEGMLVELT